MYCPRCGQQQPSEYIRFCSRCGFLMAGMQGVVANGGLTADLLEPGSEGKVSPKIRGLKQGGIMFLAGLIIVPLLGIIAGILDADPVAAGVAAVILFWGGILRMLYALIFQSGKKTLPERAGFAESVKQNFFGNTEPERVLPPAYEQPAADFTGFQPRHMNWAETNELEGAPSDENETRSFNEK